MLSAVEFGRKLIQTGDLDPIYIMLRKASDARLMTDSKLRSWCLAYWMFYHAGVASMAASAKNFWMECRSHVRQQGSTRGTERRHFRGQKAIDAVDWLAERFPDPQDAVRSLYEYGGTTTFQIVAMEVKKWPQFGPWIAWKVADMIERVLRVPVDFSNTELAVFDDPLKGGVIVSWLSSQDGEWLPEEFDAAYRVMDRHSRANALSWSVKHLQKALGRLDAPGGERKVNIQEIETVLCKYKSHLNGHYPIGKDIHEIRCGLDGWGAIAGKLALYLPPEVRP